MTQADLQALLQRYQAGECTAAEQRVVEDWYQALGEGRELNVTPEERASIGKALWNQLAQQTTETGSRFGLLWPVGRWLAAAAVVAGVGVGAYQLWWARSPQPNAPNVAVRAKAVSKWVEYPNTTQRIISIVLPDSSRVALSPASRLKYPRQFAPKQRAVYLVGKAFFEVQRDTTRPFQVYTATMLTTVLGTSFMVQAYNPHKDAVVQVKTGRVRVSARLEATTSTRKPLPASVVVLPNQRAVYSVSQGQLQRALVAEPVQLQPQSFVFDDRPVAEVLLALEKAYGVDIVFNEKAVANCTVTLSLRNQSLHGKLHVLCETLGASYQEINTQIQFNSPSCQEN